MRKTSKKERTKTYFSNGDKIIDFQGHQASDTPRRVTLAWAFRAPEHGLCLPARARLGGAFRGNSKRACCGSQCPSEIPGQTAQNKADFNLCAHRSGCITEGRPHGPGSWGLEVMAQF